jgi:cytoskeletal protein RodZ
MSDPEIPSSVGAYLRGLREQHHARLEEMARSTRIGLRHLEALEADRLSELPAPVFIKGFIRAYCGFLGVPPEEALRRFAGAERQAGAASGAAADTRAAKGWRGSPVLVSLALLVVFGLALVVLNLSMRRPPTVPVEVTAVQAEPARVATPTQAAPPIPQRLVVRAVEATWIRVQTDEGRATEELLPPGATREWTSARRFVLTVGNAGGIELELNGQRLAPLGGRGQVIHRLELPPPDAAPRS